MAGKYLELNDLVKVIDKAKKSGKKIALANGGFDILHIGHIRYLKAAGEVADILVVAINSDRSLRALKGEHRAEINERGRAKIIGSLSFVDYVTVFDERRVDNVILALKPDFHCKGTDYTEETVPEKDVVRSYGGRIAIVGGSKIRSTSDIIRDIMLKKGD